MGTKFLVKWGPLPAEWGPKKQNGDPKSACLASYQTGSFLSDSGINMGKKKLKTQFPGSVVPLAMFAKDGRFFQQKTGVRRAILTEFAH